MKITILLQRCTIPSFIKLECIKFVIYQGKLRLKIIVAEFVLAAYMVIDSIAQTMPLVYSVEDVGANYPIPNSFNPTTTIKLVVPKY